MDITIDDNTTYVLMSLIGAVSFCVFMWLNTRDDA